MQVSRELV